MKFFPTGAISSPIRLLSFLVEVPLKNQMVAPSPIVLKALLQYLRFEG